MPAAGQDPASQPAAWAYRTEADLEGCNLHLAALEAAGLLGIVEEDGRATAYFPARVDGLPLAGRWEAVPDVDHLATWRASIEPVVVGPFAITPPWREAPEAEEVLVIEPAQAFGTGHHETTVGCLAALAGLDLAGARVDDVGTGTGILAIAAARRGAAEVRAVDVDPVAVATARANAAANGVAVAVAEGSVEALGQGPADVVLANLDTATLAALAADLAGRLAPGGVLVASGVSVERTGEAVAALEAAGLDVATAPGQAWVALTARHRSRGAGGGHRAR
ncbi:MAG: 50S ribosomal protein L11 methyltransferase [Egibacteraceae bacterium]